MTTLLQQEEKVLGGLWGAVVADALGVPVEFRDREELRTKPVTDMREYGSHNQPKGTWSDDSSLMLCTIDSLVSKSYDLNDMGQQFVSWLKNNHWTPWGEVFDIGITTRRAISNLERGIEPEQAGLRSEKDNGNGSLMRILPIVLYWSNASTGDLLNYSHQVSSLTHGHIRSQMACGFYCVMAANLLHNFNPTKAYEQAIEQVLPIYQQSPYAAELAHFERIFQGKIGELPENEIRSGGYVIHTLEASIWCLLNSNSYSEAVLKAVNLGNDTDTTAIVTGGLAGLYYGLASVPSDWLKQIVKHEEIEQLFKQFVEKIKE